MTTPFSVGCFLRDPLLFLGVAKGISFYVGCLLRAPPSLWVVCLGILFSVGGMLRASPSLWVACSGISFSVGGMLRHPLLCGWYAQASPFSVGCMLRHPLLCGSYAQASPPFWECQCSVSPLTSLLLPFFPSPEVCPLRWCGTRLQGCCGSSFQGVTPFTSLGSVELFRSRRCLCLSCPLRRHVHSGGWETRLSSPGLSLRGVTPLLVRGAFG